MFKAPCRHATPRGVCTQRRPLASVPSRFANSLSPIESDLTPAPELNSRGHSNNAANNRLGQKPIFHQRYWLAGVIYNICSDYTHHRSTRRVWRRDQLIPLPEFGSPRVLGAQEQL